MPRSGHPASPPRTITTTSMGSTASTASTTPLSPPSNAGVPTSYFSPISPTSSISSTTSPASPAERSFFGAIAQSVRLRSRSRSRNRRSRSRSPRSPSLNVTSNPVALPSPPVKPGVSSRSTSSKTLSMPSDRAALTQRKSHARGSSQSSHGSLNSPTGTMPVAQCGRHSNDWLFGGFSVTDTVRSFMRDKRDE